ncbi:MAG: hypothetical protein D6738_02390 [Acidobacteria bacterium]|nr:MAG: hypothetical protein D6738_02390 [Acidobacteriota bacterium]
MAAAPPSRAIPRSNTGPSRAGTVLLALLLAALAPALAAGRRSPSPLFEGRGPADGAADAPAPPRTGAVPSALPAAQVFPREASVDRWRGVRGALLFDGARFDPLAHGEPELSAFVPELPEFDDLPVDAPRLAIVQLDHAPGPSDAARLAAAGLELLAYVPHRAWLVRGPAPALADAAGLAGVRWVGRYRPGYKVDRRLGLLAAGLPTGGRLPGEDQDAIHLALMLVPGTDPGAVGSELSRAIPGLVVEGTAHGDPGPELLAVSVPLAGLRVDLARIANLDTVVAVEPRGRVRLHNDDAAWIGQSYDVFARQNYDVSATIWNQGLMGEGELIGLLDTGVDPDVCWLEDAAGLPAVSSVPPVGSGAGPLPVDDTRRKIVAYNLLSSFQATATAYDVRTGDPHGTWAAVSAVGDNPDRPADESNPTAPHHDFADGMAPRARLIVEDFADDAGALVGLGRTDWLILDAIFEQMYGAGARIATNSWGIPGNQYDTTAFFADRMTWTHPDFLVIVSAGNEGPYAGTLDSPATAKSVLAVGASDARLDSGSGLDPDNVWEFSSRGPTIDGRTKPDVMFSGHRVVTGDSDHAETGRTCTTAEVTGTSFAAPLVAGYASLVREYFRTGFYPSGTRTAGDGFEPSAALVKASVLAGARSMVGSAGSDVGPCQIDTCDVTVQLCTQSLAFCEDDADCRRCTLDTNLACTDDRDCDLSRVRDDAPNNEQGWGRLHLDDVLFFAGDPRGLAAWDVPRSAGLATGESWRRTLWVEPGSEDLKVVLSWPDPPALIASPFYLVNDLDLKVTAPDGTVYWGNAWGPRDREPLTVTYTVPGMRPADEPDTVEMVRIASFDVAPGAWTVEVVGESVPGSPWVGGGMRQDFAVVAVGPVRGDAGEVAFDRPVYACSGTARVEVSDPGRSGPLSVVVSTGSGDRETVALTDLGGGRFEAFVPLASGVPLDVEGGTLEVADGDRLVASYDDDDPVRTLEAFATVDCRGELIAGPVTASGGCDGDTFVDAGEEVDLSVRLANGGVGDLEDVSATLVSHDPRLYVIGASASWGALPAGAAADPATPFRVSLRADVPAGTEIGAELRVRSPGLPLEVSLPLTLVTEVDEISTNGTWTEDFTTASPECYDGDPAPTPGRWYWFDVDGDCMTSEPTWNTNLCFGDRQALLPSCTGQLLSDASETHHRLVSPKIDTGAEGSRTIIERIRFTESYHFRINEDGQRCDWVGVFVFTNRDSRLLPSGYWRDLSADGTDEIPTLEPETVSEWILPPAPDATQFQLIFETAWRDPPGSDTCNSSQGDEFRWRVDDVAVDYVNIARQDDATPCTPACSAPGIPGAVTVVALPDGRLLAGWDPVPGAHHYDVWLAADGNERFVGRADAPDSSIVLEPPAEAAPWTITVEAVDASGLCPSLRSTPVVFDEPTACRQAPGAVADLAVVDAAEATCRAALSWSPAASGCGGPLTYRVYRSRDPGFAPSPDTLLAEVSATDFSDTSVTSGWNDAGEPFGDEYTWEVRAFEASTGREGPGARFTGRVGGPRQTGTWIDNAGDQGAVKMTGEVLVDENGSGVGWSRSPIAIRHDGAWSYWSDPDPLGTGRYEALSCISLVGPEIELAPAGASVLSLWLDYEIEYEWDGLVVELSVDGGPFFPIDPIGGYPGTFAQTVAPPCQGAPGGTGSWINACDYPPTQGCFTGPQFGGLSGWQEARFDLSAWSGSRVRFRLNLSTDCGTGGAAIVDELSVSDARLPTHCEPGPCLPAPEFAGLLAATDADPSLASGIELSWGSVSDWGGGGPGTFEVWRDGALVASLPASATSYLDDTAEPNRPHRYQVIARAGSGCALGSPSRAALEATDCGDLDAAVRDALRLDVTLSPGRTSVVLRADPVPGAAAWRFPWSTSPQGVSGSPDALVSSTPEARHLVAGDAGTYFYLVEDMRPDGCP